MVEINFHMQKYADFTRSFAVPLSLFLLGSTILLAAIFIAAAAAAAAVAATF